MSSKKTEFLGLNQWEASDPVLRADFNADNAKVDAFAAAQPHVAAGSYTGDGAASRFISLGFTPKGVLVQPESGDTNAPRDFYYTTGLAVVGSPCEAYGVNYIAVAEGGFSVANHVRTSGGTLDEYASANYSGTLYHYLAIG